MKKLYVISVLVAPAVGLATLSVLLFSCVGAGPSPAGNSQSSVVTPATPKVPSGVPRSVDAYLRGFHYDIAKLSPVPNDIRKTSGKTFPYGGAALFRPRGIADKGEIRFNDAGVPDTLDQLTPKEQQLVVGYRGKAPWSNGRSTLVMPLLSIENAMFRAYKATGTAPDGPFAPSFVSGMVGPRTEDLMTIPVARREEVLVNFSSPITGKILDFSCKTFSPGNAYIEMITDPALRAEVNKQLGIKARDGDGMFYVRVYGEKGIILETVKILSNTAPTGI